MIQPIKKRCGHDLLDQMKIGKYRSKFSDHKLIDWIVLRSCLDRQRDFLILNQLTESCPDLHYLTRIIILQMIFGLNQAPDMIPCSQRVNSCFIDSWYQK